MSFIPKTKLGGNPYFLMGLGGMSATFGAIAGDMEQGGILDRLTSSSIQKTNLINNISMVTYGLSKYYFANAAEIQPAAMLAGVPMPSVQELSHAMSNRELKYRATGGIFLAHQEGGDQSLRIVGQAFGANRYIFLTILDFLFLYGGARQIDLLEDQLKSVTVQGNLNTEQIETLSQTLPGYEKPKTWKQIKDDLGEDIISTDEWKPFYAAAIDVGNEEAHLTFPVITRERVYTSMYIETYEYTESVENGLDCITYSIFLRKYRPNMPLDFEMVKEDGKERPSFYYREATSKDIRTEAKAKYDKLITMMDVSYTSLLLLYRVVQLFTQKPGSLTETIGRILGFRLSSGFKSAGGLTLPEKEMLVFGL